MAEDEEDEDTVKASLNAFVSGIRLMLHEDHEKAIRNALCERSDTTSLRPERQPSILISSLGDSVVLISPQAGS